MKTIKFSHIYYKLPEYAEQYKAVLLHVEKIDLKDLSPALLEYDTSYFKDEKGVLQYRLNPGKYLLLIFRIYDSFEHWNIFTTLRPAWPAEKEKYYRDAIGEEFKIEVNN